MGRKLPDEVLESPSELKARLAAERVGTPFLLYREGGGQQLIIPLEDRVRLTVGRGSQNDASFDWDDEVSGLHAILERLGEHWTVSDDGLSTNGTYVNGERISGRHRLRDGDLVQFGRTTVVFAAPLEAQARRTLVASRLEFRPSLSPAQLRVLVSLCRPLKEPGAYATPATNQQIADELFLSVEAVKSHLRALFGKFGIESLPQNQKRSRLVELALKSGVVSRQDL